MEEVAVMGVRLEVGTEDCLQEEVVVAMEVA